MAARLYCVDGTNLVRTAYGYGGPAHAAQEESDARRLVEILAAVCEDAGDALELELFFDGAFRVFPGARPANMRVSFTRELSADDLILDRVRSRVFGTGRTATVVTADAELGRLAQAEGGKWLRVEHGSPAESVARRIGGRFSR
jgi:hypothetical protein